MALNRRGPVAQNFAAGGQHAPEVAEFFAHPEHGGYLRWQKARRLFQRGHKAQSAFDVGGEQMETHAESPVAALGDGKNHCFHGLAAFKRAFQQIEEQPRAFRPAHWQREKKMNQGNRARRATGQKCKRNGRQQQF